MSQVLRTYSGKEINFSLANDGLGVLIQAGGVQEKGINKVIVRMAQTQSDMKVGADGAVQPNVKPGDQGEIEIQVWQTSTLHDLFISLHNKMTAARDAGDVSNWWGSSIAVEHATTAAAHLGTNSAPVKIPDKEYGDEAVTVSWVFACCNIINQ